MAPVSALTGLKARLPQSLTQMSERMSGRTGDLKPAAMKARLSACTRSLRVPSGSPKGSRFWLRWAETSITPGSTISPAAKMTQPMARSGPIRSHWMSPGSTAAMRRPS